MIILHVQRGDRIVLCDMYVHLIPTGFNLKKELCDLKSGVMTSAEERPKMKGGAPTVPREEITKHLMETKEHEFTEVQHFTVCAATWNVNGKAADWKSSYHETCSFMA